MTTTRPNIRPTDQFSISDTARLLGVDRKTIYRWRKYGYFKTKTRRINKMPFVEGREILKIFDLCV